MADLAQTNVTEQYVLEHFDQALAHRHIEVYCQPVIRTISGQICGLEALARWEDPELGLLTPDKFIGVLEKHRRIHELDGYIVRRVCEAMRELMDTDAFVPVSVNLSRLDYELCDIFQVVESAVYANKIPRSHICIEITESQLNSNEELMRSNINRFQWAGYPVWMDDFGSGYSSLNVLKDYRFDELKIDMRFLSDFHPRSKLILASIVNMAKQIGIQTLTEGVETVKQFEYLRNIGCEKAQGNLFGAAMPLDRCLDHAKERGMTWEPPLRRKYYDDLGKLNLLSATPFISADEQKDPGAGRDLNSIPLAVMETQGDEARFLYANQAFEDTVSGVNWKFALALDQDPLARDTRIPIGRFSASLRRLLDETRTFGGGGLYFVHDGEYYELRTKCLGQGGGLFGLLVRIDNLSQGAELNRQNALDEGMRQVYSIFERVSLLDLKTNTVEALFLDSHAEAFHKRDASEAARIYAEDWIFPEDRERYLQFVEPSTLSERLNALDEQSLSTYFRTRSYRGDYSWKCYTVLQVRPDSYYILVRDIDRELRELERCYGTWSAGGQESDGFPVSLLWDSVKRSSPLKFFWKDRNRRFLGASQSFLNFYGFSSLDDILGKTDEDMGWHIHPDAYRENELRVLCGGVPSLSQPGTCIARGENRNIIASKFPLYNVKGEIEGLIGYFAEVGEGGGESHESFEQIREDKLTGLLNTRGLDEDMYAYRDEYELRGRDFARIEISVEELGAINRRYGYDFGDELLRVLARELLRCCGMIATIGRETGSQFVALIQFTEPEDIDALVKRIRAISSESLVVNGIPFTTYLAVGAAAYSESENLEEQTTQAQLRRMTDDVEHVPPKHLRESMSRIFYLYDNLPLSYAVYKLYQDEDGDDDAIVLYGNKLFSAMVGKPSEAFVGKRVRRLFEGTDHTWLDLARRAAGGELITREAYYETDHVRVNMTASQVIGEGFCAFTYQLLDS